MTTSPQAAAHANAYLRTRVLTASPEELRLMLLEGAVKFATQGRDGLARARHEAAFQGFSQARDIVFELMTTIREDIDPELARNAKALYAFIYRTLVEGAHEKDLAKIDKVIELLEFERETWVLLMRRLAEERGAAPRPAPAAFSAQA
ncbi:MAG: flagellar export chaperone FliS [Planctomycetota bacterium]|nr:flagellar export chaperone FliS [Planctomycetota bacterium]